MRFLAELAYLRVHAPPNKQWVTVGKLFWRQANMLGLVMLHGIPFPCDANRFSGPHVDGIRLIAKAKQNDADPLPYIQGDLWATIPTWEKEGGRCTYDHQWCGYATSTEDAVGEFVIYTIIIEVIPVIWTRENRGLWLEVKLDEQVQG